MHSPRQISVVLPVYNERPSLKQLYEELVAVAQNHGYEMEFIFVDDGSTDGSWEVIRELARVDPRVRGIRFRRNFGKAAALSAGFDAARFPIVMTLDADLQDDPAEIPRFLAKMEEDRLDVVSGWKRVRHDPWHKVIPSRIFNWWVSRVTGVHLHDHNCGMKCYRREVLAEIELYGELHRFVPVLAGARGFRCGEIEIHHRPRLYGRSKYGISRLVKGALDLLTVTFLTGFRQRPQHLLGGLGLVAFVIGALLFGGLAVWWLVSRIVPGIEPVHLHNRPIVVYSLGLLLIGVHLISLGLLAELFVAYHSRDRQPYSIAETTGGSPSGPTISSGSESPAQPEVPPGPFAEP
ncbi:MAG: glycosyltransferase family 2 protein [Thermoguttaceae bacterium]|nr:glycosyltransferase family 2 protein [Thermoguttaceae bacterium]MDW8079566.1 glycosyltransferase family 2 protein [Thermoguttaceae bacterium]